jgi:hypothetical protein
MIFLPFEITVLVTSRTKDEIKKILLNDIDQTKLFDITKRFKASFKHNKAHLRTNLGTVYRTQHYYFTFAETKNNAVRLTIFSRNNFIMICLYCLFAGTGIFSLVTSCTQKSIPGILASTAFTIFMFVMTNFLHKLERKEDVRYFIQKINS